MDIFDLVMDLQMDRQKVEGKFKEVGASIKPFSSVQIVGMGIDKAEAREHRQAVFKLPLEFPKAFRGRRR